MDSSVPVFSEQRSLLSLVNVVLRRWVSVVVMALAIGFIVGLISITSQRVYSSIASFVPESRSAVTNLGGIAAQFGVALPAGEPGQSPDFYADLVRSREIVGRVVLGQYTRDGDTVDLFDALDVSGQSEALRMDAAIRGLGERTAATVSSRTGVVRLTVKMPHPELAQQVASRYLELLNTYNLRTRQTRGAAEREFAGRRVEEVREDLRRAEDALQEFMLRNRDGRDAPELSFEYDRLSRAVSMQQQIFTSLLQAYEEARIDEVRDTPVISVVERPSVPVRPDSRGTVFKTLFGLFLGGMLGVVSAYWREFLHGSSGAHRRDADEFLELRASLVEDLKHPLRALRRRPVARRPAPGSPGE